MKTFFRGLIDLVGFVVGPFFTAYYLFDFSHGPAGPGPYYYYYRQNAQLGLALGIALICLCFVIRRWQTQSAPEKIRQPARSPLKRSQMSSPPKTRPKQDKKASPPDRNRGGEPGRPVAAGT